MQLCILKSYDTGFSTSSICSPNAKPCEYIFCNESKHQGIQIFYGFSYISWETFLKMYKLNAPASQSSSNVFRRLLWSGCVITVGLACWGLESQLSYRSAFSDYNCTAPWLRGGTWMGKAEWEDCAPWQDQTAASCTTWKALGKEGWQMRLAAGKAYIHAALQSISCVALG